MIDSKIDTINDMNKKGLFIFSGIDEYGKECFHMLEPQLCSSMFYYNSGSKFITDHFSQYYEEYIGSIIFANGDECLIYKFNGGKGKFEVHKFFNSLIMGKTRQGGSSSARFGRIVDNTRKSYIIKVIENINQLCKNGNWIFGSKDITNDIMERKNEITINLNFGGYIDFDKSTINDTQRWIKYIKTGDSNDNILGKIIEYFETNPDLLGFDQSILDNLEMYEYIVITPLHPRYREIQGNEKIIKLIPTSKYYGKIKDFICIGKYYYSEQNVINNDDFM